MTSIIFYLQLARAPAVFTAISNILASQLIIEQGLVNWFNLIALSCSSSLIYIAGMVLNDCFDIEVDRRERPSRPLPSGQIPLLQAWLIGWFCLIAGLLISAILSLTTLIIAILLATAVLLYDGLLKNTGVGPLVMGSCRYLNWLLGLSTVTLTFESYLIALPIFTYVISLTYLSRAEISADKRSALLVCIFGVLATSTIIGFLILNDILKHDWAIVLLLPALFFVLFRLIKTYMSFTPGNIQQTMKMLIMGIIPLDTILVFAGGPWWGGLFVILLIIPGRMLAKKIYIT